jgi:hypothetical protein
MKVFARGLRGGVVVYVHSFKFENGAWRAGMVDS